MIPRSPDDALAALEAMGEQADSSFDLTAAGFCCAIHDDPDRDLAPALAVLDELSAMAKADQPKTTEALAMICFGKFGFGGALEDFDDPRNASLPDILVQRRGLPVGLGLVWRHVAKLSGAPLRGTNTPGRFLMRLDEVTGQAERQMARRFDLIDVFEGGAIVSETALTALALQTGEKIEAKSLAAVPDRVMAVRLQTNIAMRARADGDLEAWARAAQRRALLCPWDGRLHLDHAEAAAALGHIGQARAAAQRATAAPRGDIVEAAEALVTKLNRKLH